MKKKIYVALLLTIHSMQSSEQPLILSLQKENQKLTFITNKNLSDKYLKEEFFVEYQPDIDLNQLNYSILTLPYLLNIIGVVWISGQDYYIEEMDQDLFKSLQIVKKVAQRFYPHTSFNGNLIPKKLVDNTQIWSTKNTNNGVIMPFSQGLDSVCSSLRQYPSKQLLITVRGFPDMPLDKQDDKWAAVEQMVEGFAHTYGHENAYIWSNFHDFFNWKALTSISAEIPQWRVCMVEDLGWIGLAAPIVITKGYKKLILPGNDDWGAYHPGAGCPLFIDPITYAGVENKCDAFELKRLQKLDEIKRICSKYNLEKPYILGCAGNLDEPKNCCKCQKCMASLLYFAIQQENCKEYGLNADVATTLDYYKKTFFPHNRFDVYSVRWYKYCQELALAKYDTFTPELKQFFDWYLAINFNDLLIPSPRVKIDWQAFTDLYNFPEEVLAGTYKEDDNYYIPTSSRKKSNLKKNIKYTTQQLPDFDKAMICHAQDANAYYKIAQQEKNQSFFEFAKKQYTEHIIKNPKIQSAPRIPKIIHQIWLGPKTKPEGFDHWHKSWLDLNPGWEYKLWTDDDIESLSMINKSLFDKEVNYGAKSDIMRLEILNQFGGLYVDIDFQCIKSIDWIHHVCDFYTSFFQVNYLEYKQIGMSARIPNGIIAAAPGHPLIKTLMRELNEQHAQYSDLKSYYGILLRTGPDFLTNVLHKYMPETPGINIVFPANFFFSWTGSPLELHVQPETLAIHYYTGSWGK